MPRISVFIAALALLGTTAAAVAAGSKDPKNSYPYCYSSNCVSECTAVSVYKGCEVSCQRMASTRPACKGK
jgi:hypothetical protein